MFSIFDFIIMKLVTDYRISRRKQLQKIQAAGLCLNGILRYFHQGGLLLQGRYIIMDIVP